MSSPGEPPASWGPADIAEARADALAVVSDALNWQLADARWRAVEQALAEMEAALAASDFRALAAATADLELAGPLRITRIGDTPVIPPAPPVRSRLDQLVHSLGTTPPAVPPDDNKDGKRDRP